MAGNSQTWPENYRSCYRILPRAATGSVPIKVMVPLLCMGLYTFCMVCHGELARLKPHPRYLTHYFVMISVAGVWKYSSSTLSAVGAATAPP